VLPKKKQIKNLKYLKNAKMQSNVRHRDLDQWVIFNLSFTRAIRMKWFSWNWFNRSY